MAAATCKKWATSEAHQILVTANAAARFKSLLRHKREAEAREDARCVHMEQQQAEALGNARRVAAEKAARRARMARGTGKSLSRLWKKARLVLVPASFMVECRERHTKKALKHLDPETMVQVAEVVAALEAGAAGPRGGAELLALAQDLAGRELHPGIWEAAAVDEAVAASGFGLAVSAGFAGAGGGGGGRAKPAGVSWDTCPRTTPQQPLYNLPRQLSNWPKPLVHLVKLQIHHVWPRPWVKLPPNAPWQAVRRGRRGRRRRPRPSTSSCSSTGRPG